MNYSKVWEFGVNKITIKGSRVSFFAGCINFFSYIFLLPFSVKWDDTSNSYIVKPCLFRKIYYGLGSIYVVVYVINDATVDASKIHEHPENVINIFKAIMQPCVAVLQVYIALIFLFQPDRIVKVLKKLRVLSHPVSKLKVLAICFCLLTCMVVLISLSSYPIIAKKWITRFLKRAMVYLPFPISVENSLFDCSVQLIYCLFFAWTLLFCMPEIFGIIIVLSLLWLALTYRSRLTHNVSVEDGYALYKNYKSVMDQMNELWGPLFLIFYVSGVIYYAQAPYVIIAKHPDIMFTIFLLENIVIWGVGAHVHKTMTFTTRQWINMKQDECGISVGNRLKLFGLKYDVDSEPIGITCAFFTLTNQFLGSMLGVLVAYALIIYQQENHH